MRSFTLVAAALISLAAPAPAFAGTKERVEALEAAVAQLRASQPAALEANAKIDRLEAEMRSLTGRIEELTYELEQARARLDSVSAALAGDSLGAEAPAPLAGAPAGPNDLIANEISRSSGAGAVELPLDPDTAFSYAADLLLSGDYARAEQAFKMFIETFPNHPRTADARFRLGEVYLANSKNTEAADAFIAFIRSYPQSARGAEAYLKLGTAFSRLSKPDEACKVFKTLKSKYPNAAPAVLQRTDVEMARISCK